MPQARPVSRASLATDGGKEQLRGPAEPDGYSGPRSRATRRARYWPFGLYLNASLMRFASLAAASAMRSSASAFALLR